MVPQAVLCSQMWKIPYRLGPHQQMCKPDGGLLFPGFSPMCTSKEGWSGKWQRSHCMGHLWCPALLPPHPPVPPEDATEIMCSMWGPDSTSPLLSPTCNIPQSKLLACKPSLKALLSWGTQAKTVVFLPSPYQLSEKVGLSVVQEAVLWLRNQRLTALSSPG